MSGSFLPIARAAESGLSNPLCLSVGSPSDGAHSYVISSGTVHPRALCASMQAQRISRGSLSKAGMVLLFQLSLQSGGGGEAGLDPADAVGLGRRGLGTCPGLHCDVWLRCGRSLTRAADSLSEKPPVLTLFATCQSRVINERCC